MEHTEIVLWQVASGSDCNGLQAGIKLDVTVWNCVIN